MGWADIRAKTAAARTSKAPPPARTSLPVVPCRFQGDDLNGMAVAALKLDTRKRWRPCGNPKLPLGSPVVCPCMGCGPSCRGYERGPD